MDATGLKALTSSSRHLLRLSSKAPPLRCRPSPRVSSLRYVTSSERCRAHALSDGCGAPVAAASVSSKKEFLQVVLMSPQIPGNTGSIARTCAASAVKLHLIEPLGFQVDDVKLKRAGLDYWPYVVVKVHSSWPEFREYFKKQEGEKRLLAFTKRGTNIHSASLPSTPHQNLIHRKATGLYLDQRLAGCRLKRWMIARVSHWGVALFEFL
ncbi:putative tRNA (cytidine(34)-2'-O)-methyltransferase isoform X2 [Salvia splendens]|uniref:putative tRNA (cytidine(34)-2'-O)-methyltransferase isoform X2 n=1 Tax=Salvia splendens TaxID=180675 RepID=UPI001C27A35F|nr:putative tRNA (cytidine(34)-2'-O)-methyltransferase isoform X2 [Salvia splendens]